MHNSRSALSSAAEYRDEFVCGSGFPWVVSLQNMSKLHEINLPIPYPTNTCATTYCTKLVLEIDLTIDSYLTTFLEKLTVLYCKNVVPQYVLTFIYFRPVLCFTLLYNCSLTVRNKRICYVMLPVAMVGQSSGSTAESFEDDIIFCSNRPYGPGASSRGYITVQ